MSWKEVGYSSRVHGIKGEFTLMLNEYGDALQEGTQVLLKPFKDKSCLNPKGELFFVEKIRGGGKVIGSFKSVDNRNRAEEMVPLTIFMHEDQLDDPSADSFFASDLIGFELIEKGVVVGKVLNCYSNGHHDVVEIALEHEKIDLPLNDQFFPEIDFDKRQVTLNRPEVIE